MNDKQIKYIHGVCDAVSKSNNHVSKLDSGILDINGMSSNKVRHFMNNIGSVVDNYLEVGSYHGSTLCSVCNHNKLNAIAFENFSEFQNQQDKNDLEKNVSEYCHNQATMIYEDFFLYQGVNDLPKFDMFFYDGIHTIISQYQALKKIYDKLSNVFILIVDDWKCEISKPKTATMKAIYDLSLNCNLYLELPADDFVENRDGYHCGMGIFVLTKKNI